MEEVRRRLGDLPGAVLSVEKEGYRITLSPQHSKTDWTAEIRHIMRLLQESRTERHPLSLVIDEFQKVAEIDPNLPGLFKSLTDLELRGISLVLSGSRRHVIAQAPRGARCAAARRRRAADPGPGSRGRHDRLLAGARQVRGPVDDGRRRRA